MQLYPFLCLLLPLVTSFSPGSLSPPLSSSLSPYKTTSNAPNALFSTPAEFGNYMVKSQEAKQIMQAEIDGLKKQIASGAGGAASADGGDAKKIAEYEAFISKYIVNASEEKKRAVEDAEASMKKKYEAVMAQFLGEGASPFQLGAAPETTYDKRNKMVSEAGKKGRSRWGDEEIAAALAAVGLRAEMAAKGASVPSPTAASTAAPAKGMVNFGAALLGK